MTSCPTGFSPASSTDATCVRDCASGDPVLYPNGAYYSSNDMCWPVCPPLSTDTGPACAKNISNRSILNWQTDATKSQDYKRRRDPNNRSSFLDPSVISNVAGCPPNYTAFMSASETYSDGSPVVKCFYNCADTGDGTQTELNEMGQCLVNVCPTNEITGSAPFAKATPSSGSYTFIDNSQRTTSGNSLTTVCNRGGVTADRLSDYRVVRNYSLPSCPSGFKAEFFKSNQLNSWTSVTSAAGISPSDVNYSEYFSCTAECNNDGSTTNKRYGSFCAPDCPDNGDLNFIVANLTNGSTPYYQDLVAPPNLRAQSKCMKKLASDGTGNLISQYQVAPVDAPAQVGGSCPQQTIRRWKLATNSDPATQAAWQTPQLNGDPLYILDNSSSDAYPNATACVDSAVICNNKTALGFIEGPTYETIDPNQTYDTNPNSFTYGQMTAPILPKIIKRAVRVLCGNSPTPSNFIDDPQFTNVWQRYMFYKDPQTTYPSNCGGNFLMGNSNFIKDNSDGVGMGSGLGYAYEIPPSPFLTSSSDSVYTTQTQNADGTFSPSYYVFGQIVASGKDEVAYLYPNGSPILDPLADTTEAQPNLRQSFEIGPFFRCKLTHTVNSSNAGLPATTLAYPKNKWNLPPGSAGTWTSDDGIPLSRPMYLQDGSVALASPSDYWEVTEIPTETRIDNLRVAGPISSTSTKNFKQELCSPSSISNGLVIPEFCPPVCLSRCPGVNMPPSNSDIYGNTPSSSYTYFDMGNSQGKVRYELSPTNGQSGLSSQAGIYEYIFETPNFPGDTTLNAVCYPRCGSSAQYYGTSNLCVTKSKPIDNNVVSGFSWCPPQSDINGNTDPLSIGKSEVQNVAPTNPITNYENSPPTVGVPWSNVCLTPCPPGSMVSNKPPQNQCVTKCDKDGRFIDNGNYCIKVPYQKEVADPLNQTFADTISSIEQSSAETANTVSKFALGGGPQSLFQGVLVVIAVCGILTLVLFALQYQAGRLSALK